MSHYKLDTKPVGRTHYDWLGVGASVGKLVNQWSLRNDLVVGLVEETTIGAPACFNPASAEIEVCISKAFGVGVTAKEVGELTQRKNQLKNAVATGAIYHEALHARIVANSQATIGKYAGGAAGDTESTYVANYSY